VARLPESIEVSVKDIPEVIAALEQAKALEARHAALVAAAREWSEFYDEIIEFDNGERGMVQLDHGHDEYEARMVVMAALRAALDGEPT
jgi:hypothetical protein